MSPTYAHAVPNPFSTMAPAEWPLLNGKSKLPNDFPEALRWGSQSDGHPGWASPAGSVMSENSLASLKTLRLNGASPPPPPPSVRGSSTHTTNSSIEVKIPVSNIEGDPTIS